MKNIKENIGELVQNSLDQDFNKANKTFGDIMAAKLGDLMDQEQIAVASTIFDDKVDDDALADEAIDEDDEEYGEDDEVEVEEAALGDDVSHSKKEPKKPARKPGLSPGALGGKAKPGLSPGALGGKVKPKPAKDPNIAAEIDAGGTKGGSGVGRQDGPGKPKTGDRHPPKKKEGPNDWIRAEAPGMRKAYADLNKVRKSEKIRW